MLINIRLRLLALQIEYHWFIIRVNRLIGSAMMNRLIKKGLALTSPALLLLTRHHSRHCLYVAQADERFQKDIHHPPTDRRNAA